MGIFSFGKKDDAPSRRGADSSATRGGRNARVERRSRRTERPAADADAMLLDPTLPEKQRARRRLVGAIALVVAAIVVLPMVLDSHPKPVTDDISIDIPNRPVAKASTAVQDTQAGVAPDNPPAPDAAPGASGLTSASPNVAVASSPAAGAKASAKSATAGTSSTANSTANNSPAAQAAPSAAAQSTKPHSNATQAANSATNGSANNSARAARTEPSTDAEKDTGSPASPPGARFAVQLGVFPDDASARNWAAKLKAAGVPAYTERRKQADGSMRTLLRAGPFADRAAASAAIAKVREAGLGAGANGSSGQSAQ
ncbi:SPOR domain-containing protein [Paraburkholderia kururiensis]|uniref:SPOR domain-containing protein n=1 Tax=Paraburkholderia kururiensis TaxID=984307 RepID=A0ABZ0WNW2_9BURK|nr:SPOR domain-containing protein [Paraburkholderia kururiensis]WQD78978.1 SPOR domain-containing protein [Paraburkholderia kururiensis]